MSLLRAPTLVRSTARRLCAWVWMRGRGDLQHEQGFDHGSVSMQRAVCRRNHRLLLTPPAANDLHLKASGSTAMAEVLHTSLTPCLQATHKVLDSVAMAEVLHRLQAIKVDMAPVCCTQPNCISASHAARA